MSKSLLRVWKCPACGHESEEWYDFISENPEKIFDSGTNVTYIKRNRTATCPNCKASLY